MRPLRCRAVRPGPPLGAGALAAQTRAEAGSQLLGRRCLCLFSQRCLLVSACSRTQHLARFWGSGSRGHELGLEGILAGDPWEGALREDRDPSWLLPTHLMCVRDRGGLGADCTSPAWKEGAGSSGSTGAGSLRSSMASPRGRASRASPHGPVEWMTASASHRAAGLLRHMDIGIGSWGPPGSHLSDKALCTSLHLPPRWPAWGLWRFLFYPMGLTMVIQKGFGENGGIGYKAPLPLLWVPSSQYQ